MTEWSRAFQRETMQSEQVRIVGILAVLGTAFLIIITRAIIARGVNEFQTVLTFGALLGVMAAYETAMLVIVRRSSRGDRSLPAWSWIFNVVIESLLPTVALLILTENPAFGPYRALVAPALLSYFFFITLSTLRLSPALARATGISSAVGYTIVVIYTIVRYPTPPSGVLPLGQGIYLTYAALLLIGGWIAGEVARQIRKHVTSALDEAIQRERVHRDLEVARSIQQALLPTDPPQIPGFDIAGWNQPADQTGGDFYFWESLGGGKTAITVADVTGHGIGPALIASVSRAYGRACVLPDSEMGAALTRIDELLCEDLPSGKLVNYILAVLDSEGDEIAVALRRARPPFDLSSSVSID